MFRPQFLLLLAAVAVPAWTAAAEIRPKRAASYNIVDQWSNKRPIPYTISTDFTAAEKQTIIDTLGKFSADMCLDFKLDLTGGGSKINYYVLFDEDRNCYGQYVKWDQKWNPQDSEVHLKRGCVQRQGITHETMHVLGFRHTQSRNDRDKYVKVDPQLTESNYIKLLDSETNNYGTPYEFNALLHYGIGTGVTDVVDQDYRMSVEGAFLTFNELKMVNLRYNCTEKCASKLDCKNGGYQHPRKCNECVCPQFYKGTLCNEEKGVINLKLREPHPLSNNFPANEALKPKQYPELFSDFQQTTPLLIMAPAGTHIKVDITYLNDTINTQRPNCNDFGAEVVDGDLTRVGKRFCIRSQTGRSFTSETNVVGFLVYALPGYSFGATVTFTAVGTPTGPTTATTVTPPTTTTTTKAPVVTTTTTTVTPTVSTTTKAPVVTTTTATTTKAPVVTTTTTPSTSTGGAWCDA